MFERDLLACEEKGGGEGRKRREQGRRQEQAQLLTASANHGSVWEPWSQLRLSLRFCLPWACIQPWAWLSKPSPTLPRANTGTSDPLPILPAWLWQLVCEPGCDLCPAAAAGPQPTQQETPAAFQLSHPELQVRWETDKPTGSVLAAAPPQARQTETIHHKWALLPLFRAWQS